MPALDRIAELAKQDAIVGLDFIYVAADQQTLTIFFHPNATQTAAAILGAVAPAQIVIHSPSGGETTPVVPVAATPAPAWAVVDGRSVLQIFTTRPGDFSRYRLRLDKPAVDPFFNDIPFSFKANCPTLLDCEPGPHDCPPEEPVDFPVNYLARDFWSFRQALLDFAAERHPAWQDRGEADLGMMLAEAMSALGDELAYYQDGVAREAHFETAAQRRSIRRHARLVDYHLHDGAGARTWLDFEVSANVLLPAGVPVRDATSRVVFETGHGLIDRDFAGGSGRQFDLRTHLVGGVAQEVRPHAFDEDETCLPAGSTALTVAGHVLAALPFDAAERDGADGWKLPGRWVLLKTEPADASVPARAWMVRLTEESVEFRDDLLGADVTRLVWEAAQATPFELEYASLVVRRNLVPATAGETRQAFFQVEPPSPKVALPPLPPALPPGLAPTPTPAHGRFAVEREAPSLNLLAPEQDEELRPSLLLTLEGSEERDLVWLDADAGREHPEENAVPEVRVFEGSFVAGVWVVDAEWTWKRSLLGLASSGRDDTHFTLDDGAWRRVAGFRRVDETGELQEFAHADYASCRGATVRFGNGEFGRAPKRETQFRVVYRLGNGRRDNVAADTLTDLLLPLVGVSISVTNPLPVTDAVAAQSAAEALLLAPEAFRAITFRAVRPEDYAEALERLPWVQRAGAQFRWTGSWLTLFATPDPRGSFTLDAAQRRALERQLDKFRMAGREAHGRDPKFANVDLEIRVCVARSSYIGEIEAAVLEALFGKRGVRPRPGFFSPDRWSFGTPLERAQLEAAIQAGPGVRAVEEMRIRRRGWFAWRPFTELVFSVGFDEIIRVENSRELPERGAVRLVMEGGA